MAKQDAQILFCKIKISSDKLAVKQALLEPKGSHLNVIWDYRV